MLDFAAAQKKRTRRIIFVLFCSMLIILGAGIIAGVSWVQVKSPTTSTTISTVSVPAFVGRDIVKAKQLAKVLGVRVKIDSWMRSKIYPINSVVTQKPLPGRPMLRDGTIFVKVSSGAYASTDTALAKETVIQKDNPRPLPQPAIQARPLSSSVVVIDAGHQEFANTEGEPVGPGSDATKPKTAGGTSGAISHTPEYKITLQIAKRLEAKLKSLGVTTIMTRNDSNVDLSNIERAEIANKYKATLFVRIHCDGSTDRKKSGISVLYPQKNQWTASMYEPSLRAATLVHRQLIDKTAAHDGGTVARNDMTGFNWAKVPSILIETGFLTNPSEETSLSSEQYQELLVKAMSDGIIEFLQQARQ